MPGLPKLIMEHASETSEGTLLCPNALLHLGTRSAVDQALSRLARNGRLMRICQGMYARPVETRFGFRPPAVEKVVMSLSVLTGETIVPCGGAFANALGFTTQVPVRSVYLTSGPDRCLKFGELRVELRHSPSWQLVAPHRKGGDTIRALVWLGPREVEEHVGMIKNKLSAEDRRELLTLRAAMPTWMAEPVSRMITDNAG
ncbi:MAG: DUF6088 family protein [Gemmatimonadetes bacterium]|nr:DUF6088 family protein [Gemmatimonadota bacterium]